MKIKITLILFAVTVILISCAGKKEVNSTIPLVGTWQLISGTLIEKGDTVITDYSQNVSFIKIINDTHFSFLQHDLQKGKDTAAVFVAGGGKYTLKDNLYTEHLEYCSARNWEGNDFSFTITIKNDTLVQSGVEIIEREGVNRVNIEKYFRVK
jgi:Lipocalin-like domain